MCYCSVWRRKFCVCECEIGVKRFYVLYKKIIILSSRCHFRSTRCNYPSDALSPTLRYNALQSTGHCTALCMCMYTYIVFALFLSPHSRLFIHFSFLQQQSKAESDILQGILLLIII